MLDDMEYELLGPGGLIKHGTTGEESYTRKADTFAKMFALTRTDIINDDLGAFDDLRQRIGRGGAIKLNNLFWTTFLSNPTTFWTAARTNYIEGATTNLAADGVGLSKGVEAFRKRRSPAKDGSKRLGGAPKRLLVPPELETVADQLYTARNSTNVKAGDANTHAGKYQPIVANQLSDEAFGGGYSATAWYLLGDKSMGSPVVVSFLNGQETPTVESADADFNTLGVQFRGFHDFGCDQGEFLGAVKSKGAA
jgi:phage major head subunit gpT-like protein